MAEPILQDNETDFEKHFCLQLEVKGQYRLHKDSEISINKDLCLLFSDLEEFLQKTQQENLLELKNQFGADWKIKFSEKFRAALANRPLFQILKEGIEVNNFHFSLIDFPPEDEEITTANAVDKNRFMAVRQYHFGRDTQRESLDIVLFVNGFAIVTIELKNQGTSGDYQAAIEQYLSRDLELPIFRQPFLHIVCDNETVKMAAAFSRPPGESDFRDFNKELVNVPADVREYPVHYLYHDILLPDRLLNYIEHYLYASNKAGAPPSWVFPRFHQQRAARLVTDDIREQFETTGKLNLRYLVQHSTGSGKSNTIVFLAQNLRNAYADKKKIFDSVIILTDRINLDSQLSSDFQKAINTDGVAAYADSVEELRKALHENKKVIVSTIQKFSHIKELADQSHKKICIIIDEAHRSQEGKYHENVTSQFQSDENGVEAELPDEQDKLIEDIQRKEYDNLAFVALTATPSDKTLEHFGKKTKNAQGKDTYTAHDVYSMDQAISEGYIMDVAKNIYTYDTVYKLSQMEDEEKAREYLPMLIQKALRQKAFEDSGIIRDKCKIMLKIFRRDTAHKLKNRARVMVVASSRLAAVKYKLFMDEELKKEGLNYKTLVAFSGPVDYKDETSGEVTRYTEDSMNKPNNPKGMKTETVFEADDDIRFLIVANKFQTGFDQPLLHTMFVDKPLRDKNAVQTLSRLNRIHPDKFDTLVVDFTGSYDAIMKAYAKYQKNVESNAVTDPTVLDELKTKLDSYGIYTQDEVNEIVELSKGEDRRNLVAINGIIMNSIKRKYEENLDRDKRDEFRTLVSRFIGAYKYIQAIFRIKSKELRDFQTFLIYLNNKLTNSDFNSLMREIESVRVIDKDVYETRVEEKDDDDDDDGTGGGGGGIGTSVKVRKTVKEVIDAINQQFQEGIPDEGLDVVEKFIHNSSMEEECLTAINNNSAMEKETVYKEILREKLYSRFFDFAMQEAPALYELLTSEKLLNIVARNTYQLLRHQAGLA